jgi:hypothetical protein
MAYTKSSVASQNMVGLQELTVAEVSKKYQYLMKQGI